MNEKEPKTPRTDRRAFLAGLAAASGSAALAACANGILPGTPGTTPPSGPGPGPGSGPAPGGLPTPADSGIDHVVLVIMENRSFDHMLGWVPGAEGRPDDVRFTDAFGQQHAPFHLASNPAYGYMACGWADPNHSYAAGRANWANGQMNGWLLTAQTSATRGDLLPIGYYQASDLDFYRGVAAQYTVCDHYFSGILAETYPNRLYLHSGATDRLDDRLDDSSLPTIWDRFKEKGISARYYFSDVPFTALYGARQIDISRQILEFFVQAATGTLPAFAMVDPRFGGEEMGQSSDDHPHADIRNGQVFINQVYESLRTSPNWQRTLMIVVYDEWGGFYDHVIPPVRPVSAAEQALGNDGRLGFRVPCLLLGPRVRQGYVAHQPFDPSSIHQLLRWRFGLNPLGVRDDDPGTVNLATALDWQHPPRTDAPLIAVSQGPFGTSCVANAPPAPPSQQFTPFVARPAPPAAGGERFGDLRAKAVSLGFRI